MLLPLLLALQQPPANYAQEEAWLCRPGRRDACAIDLATTVVGADGLTSAESFTPAADPAIDCFYVYPTVSEDTTTYSDMVAGEEERNVIRQQFARFASVCRPFAPLYRQVSLKGLRQGLSGGTPIPLDRGSQYADVLAAWRDYLQRDNNGRGVVIVGHSQGAMVLTSLIKQEVEGKPVQQRLVSAMLLGTTIPVTAGKDVGGTYSSIPLCRAKDQLGCLISFGAFRSTVPPAPRAYFGRVAAAGQEAACTNPAALAGGAAPLQAYLTGKGRPITGGAGPRPHAWVVGGAPIETPFVKVPGLLRAACVSDANGSRLEITVQADPADARADDIPGDIGAGTPAQAVWGLHLIDVNLVMGDLIDIVRAQSRAWMQRGPGSSTRTASSPDVPRTPQGRPDLSGIWQALGTHANYDIEPHDPRPALVTRPGPVVPVPAKEVVALGAIGAVPGGPGLVVGGTLPYKPEALARRAENRALWLARDPEVRCYLPGVPRATYMPYPFQIFQGDSATFITYEYAGAVRHIYAADPGEPEVDSWMGQSVGRWDGDTYEVSVRGFNDGTWFDRAGNHHSAGMKVVERYTLLGRDHMRYEATIDDPETFTRPWKMQLTLYRNVDPDARLGQFKCVEYVEELLYGHLRKTPLKP
jgi:hypothetical protein